MIFKCENCANRVNCPEKQKGYEDLCRLIEAVNKACCYNAYYSLTLKCDYWVEDKETLDYVAQKAVSDMKDRAQLRGKPLDEDCKTARTTTNEYGIADNRVFCYGLFDPKYDAPIEKCYGCKAFVENATPLKGGERE